MAGVQNDYNQQQGDPRIRVGNWVEERALLGVTGQSRGSALAHKNDTATRITGPVLEPRDYSTTTNLAHQSVLVAPHGPAFVAAVSQPRRAQSREQQRQALAAQIYAEQQAAEEERRRRDIDAASFSHKAPQNRARTLQDPLGRTVQERALVNPLNSQAITFHTHQIATSGHVHGSTPNDRGVHTHGRDTRFSKPLSETFESGER